MLRSVEFELDPALRGMLRKLCRSRSMGPSEALLVSFGEGLLEAERRVEEWRALLRAKGLDAELARMEDSIAHGLRRLMALDGRLATARFQSFEVFQNVTNLLIVLAGYQSEARHLQNWLRRKGIQHEVGPIDIPGLDGLRDRYVLRRRRADGGPLGGVARGEKGG